MKHKPLLFETCWIIGIYIINFIAITILVKPIHVWALTSNINFNENGLQAEGQGVFIPTFLVLTAVIYFIKEAIFKFKRQLQNYITLVSAFLAILGLMALHTIVNMAALLLNSLEQMSKGMQKITEDMPADFASVVKPNLSIHTNEGFAQIIEKMPSILAIAQIVLIIMLTICAIYLGRNMKESQVTTNSDLAT